jgi:hypothetical protein
MDMKSPDFAAAVVCILALAADAVIRMAEDTEVLAMIPPQYGVAFMAIVAAARWYVVRKATLAKSLGIPAELRDASQDPTPVTETSDIWPTNPPQIEKKDETTP